MFGKSKKEVVRICGSSRQSIQNSNLKEKDNPQNNNNLNLNFTDSDETDDGTEVLESNQD